MDHTYLVSSENIGPFTEFNLIVHVREPFPLAGLIGQVFTGETLTVFKWPQSSALRVIGFTLRRAGALVDSDRSFAVKAVDHPTLGPCMLFAEIATVTE